MQKRIALTLAPFALALTQAACGGETEETPPMEFARPEATAKVVMVMPVTTSSDEAMEHFMRGQRALDMGRFVDANAHFEQAVMADPSFAHAYLNVANTAASLDEFRTNLDSAAQRAETATEAEQLLVQITQQGFENDLEGQLQLATRLTEIEPNSPRAWLTLANIQTSLSNYEDARASMMKGIDLAPEFAPAYMQLGNSYLGNEPKDFVRAKEYMQKVVDLEPVEPASYDLLGDAHRALGELEEARDAYTRAAELDPTNGLPLQQRGHVNSFLGNYDEARADYDAAIALGRANQKANYALYRAFVYVHAGDPQAAVDELNDLVQSIDGMGIEEPRGVKIGVLTNVAIIAMHHGNFSAAERALEQRTQLMMERAETVGTPEFRRSEQANIAYFDGMLAARKGNYETARLKADQCAEFVEPDANPRKMEPVHEMRGLVSLLQGNHGDAIRHYEQGNPNNVYTKYHLALAHEGAGNTAEAKRLFGELADYNFNSVVFALVREEATQKRQ